MNTIPYLSLTLPLKLPIRVLEANGELKLMAGGIPVTPVNQFLSRRKHDRQATEASLLTYLRAARLYTEFCAHRGRSFLGLTNDEFIMFKNALGGKPFLDSTCTKVILSSERGRERRSVDHLISLLYSIAGDIERLYDVRFDWRRFYGLPAEIIETIRLAGSRRPKQLRREHSVKWTSPKILGLPDDQFAILLRAAYERWGNLLAEGDAVNSLNPEAQRGALFYRNVAILFVLRYAGSRRSEVVHLLLGDIDRVRRLIYLVTKGHGGPEGERLPVLLLPRVLYVIWEYVTRFRPETEAVLAGDEQHVFLSHSPQNYGQPITPGSIHAIIKELRPNLDPPWNELCTPHTLRHSFGYALQRFGSEGAIVTNMRHASFASSAPYMAGPEMFAEEILTTLDNNLGELFKLTGLTEVLGNDRR
jgi:integrase